MKMKIIKESGTTRCDESV